MYATVADLRAVIPARDLDLLARFEGEEGLSADQRLERALIDASAEIDGYLRRQVSLPLGDPPHVLNVYCRDLALWRLYRNLGHDGERLKALREGAIAWLKDVASGKVGLGDDTDAPRETSGGVAMTDGPERRLTRSSLRGW